MGNITPSTAVAMSNAARRGSLKDTGDLLQALAEGRLTTQGFFGATPATQPASASQAVVTVSAVTAVGTAAAVTGAAHYGFATSTQADAIVARVNQLVTDVGGLGTLLDELRANLVTLGLIKGSA